MLGLLLPRDELKTLLIILIVKLIQVRVGGGTDGNYSLKSIIEQGDTKNNIMDFLYYNLALSSSILLLLVLLILFYFNRARIDIKGINLTISSFFGRLSTNLKNKFALINIVIHTITMTNTWLIRQFFIKNGADFSVFLDFFFITSIASFIGLSIRGISEVMIGNGLYMVDSNSPSSNPSPGASASGNNTDGNIQLDVHNLQTMEQRVANAYGITQPVNEPNTLTPFQRAMGLKAYKKLKIIDTITRIHLIIVLSVFRKLILIMRTEHYSNK